MAARSCNAHISMIERSCIDLDEEFTLLEIGDGPFLKDRIMEDGLRRTGGLAQDDGLRCLRER